MEIIEPIIVIENPVLKAAKDYSPNETGEYLKKFDNMHLVRVLAGGSLEIDDDGGKRYGSPGYFGMEHGMAGGAIIRVAAAAVVAKINTDIPVIVGGKYPSDEKKAPAEIIAAELQYAGVPDERVICDRENLDTISEIIGLIKIAQLTNSTNIGVLTNEYHIPRIEAIIKNLEWLLFDEDRDPDFLAGLEKLRNGDINIDLVSAEEVIKNTPPTVYDREIVPALESEEMKRRVASEKRGINDLNAGNYDRLIQGGQRVKLTRTKSDGV